jgi:hypothetical protein
VQTDLQAIRDLITGAALPPTVQQVILTRFDELPKLYADLGRTYETRFSDQVVSSVGRMVQLLTAPDAGDGAPALAVALVERLRAMHDRHGVAVALKSPPAVKAKRKPKAGGHDADPPTPKEVTHGAVPAGTARAAGRTPRARRALPGNG